MKRNLCSLLAEPPTEECYRRGNSQAPVSRNTINRRDTHLPEVQFADESESDLSVTEKRMSMGLFIKSQVDQHFTLCILLHIELNFYISMANVYLKMYLFYAYKCFAYMYVRVPLICSTFRGQKWKSDSLELGLKIVVRGHLGAENQAPR